MKNAIVAGFVLLAVVTGLEASALTFREMRPSLRAPTTLKKNLLLNGPFTRIFDEPSDPPVLQPIRWATGIAEFTAKLIAIVGDQTEWEFIPLCSLTAKIPVYDLPRDDWQIQAPAPDTCAASLPNSGLLTVRGGLQILIDPVYDESEKVVKRYSAGFGLESAADERRDYPVIGGSAVVDDLRLKTLRLEGHPTLIYSDRAAPTAHVEEIWANFTFVDEAP